MNNLNIHLNIQNPKKASSRCEIRNDGLLPDEPVIQRAKEWNTRAPPGKRLGLGFQRGNAAWIGGAMW